MDISLPLWFPLAFVAPKYLFSALCIWLTIHRHVTGQIRKPLYYDYRPLLARNPFAMIGTCLFLCVALIFWMSQVRPEYQLYYYEFLIALAPVLYTWSALGAIVIAGGIAAYMYRANQTRIAGAFSLASVMLFAFVLPYYSPF
jgi:hypothetical protein